MQDEPELEGEKKTCIGKGGEIGTWRDDKGGGEGMERSSSQLKREKKKKRAQQQARIVCLMGVGRRLFTGLLQHQTSFSVALTTGRSFAARINEIQVTNQRGKAESIRLLLFRSGQTATFSLGNLTKLPILVVGGVSRSRSCSLANQPNSINETQAQEMGHTCY